MSDLRDSTLPAFSPPGNLDDLTQENKLIWSNNYISYWMTGEINANPDVVSQNRTPLLQFFNGTVTPYDTTQQPAVVSWNAFPKLVTSAYKTTPLRWQVADASRIFQDEYLEWSVARDPKTKDVLSATFTCEGPEYWQVFASYQRDDFINAMRDLNSDFASHMSNNDFFLTDPKTGRQIYNPNNIWNCLTTTGTIAHLIQPNNTLSAEIDIAAQATVIRKDKDGNVVTDPDQLIRCSAYGNPGRHSDPTIGGNINQLVQQGQGNSVSVADPVALYINQFNTDNFMFDTVKTNGMANNADLVSIDKPEEVFVWQRGDISKGQGLRLQVKVPTGRLGKNRQQLIVSNIWDTNTRQHIRYGAQIADYVTMSVSAVTFKAPKANPVPCYSATANVAAPTDQPAQMAALTVTEESSGTSARPFPFPKVVGRKYNAWAP